MGLSLREALKSFCSEGGWSYAVFWKHDCRNQMILMLGEGYYEFGNHPAVSECATNADPDMLLQEWESFLNPLELHSSLVKQQGEDQLRAVVGKMVDQIHVIGEGFVGHVALAGKHQWIFRTGGNSMGPADFKSVSEVASGWKEQFLVGIQTIAVISVSPHGVVQLGSTQMIAENLELVSHVRSVFIRLGRVPGALPYMQKPWSQKLELHSSLGETTPSDFDRNFNAKGVFPPLIADIWNKPMLKTIASESNYQSQPSFNALSCDSIPACASASPLTSNSTGLSPTQYYNNSLQKAFVSVNPSNSVTVQNGMVATGDAQVIMSGGSGPIFPSNNKFPLYDISSISGDRSLVMGSGAVCSTSSFMEQELLTGVQNQGLENRTTASSSTRNGMDSIFDLSFERNRQLGSVHGPGSPKFGNINGTDITQMQTMTGLSSQEENRLFQSPWLSLAGSGGNNPVSCYGDMPLTEISHSVQKGLVGKSNSGKRSPESSHLSYDENSANISANNCLEFVNNGDVKVTDAPLRHCSVDELFDSLGFDLGLNEFQFNWENTFEQGEDSKHCNSSTGISTISDPALDAFNKGRIGDAFFSNTKSDNLLDAMIADIHSVTNEESDENLSCKTALTKLGSSFSSISEQKQVRLVDLSQAPLDGDSKRSSAIFNPKFSVDKLTDSQTDTVSRSPLSNICVENGQSIKCEETSISHAKKLEEPLKVNRKRARPGESTRPRPKDRQMIQDRVKELREIVPNGAKCSIDALLEKTINHMLFLQSVTKHVDKLKHTGEPKMISKEGGLILKDNYEGGATWAFDVGSQPMICPIIVENLNAPRHMLVEMLCDERGFFLEIADIIRGLGLTIVKGVMEACNNKIWARFAVEKVIGSFRQTGISQGWIYFSL
ncbi:transcription factor LHW isoform X2 [Amborella trichopoda]|uniref:transcription factor LHW isoform X2 n=1 Tax=Amborella trichopoda TaxID=13333 RepID=UPI0005D3A4AB|nr:transcription factor LHW isoform X2 [Amborella trichopoda]|eukprot:XP_011627129.1 transcription factor LHW isoform X2 [Amborella trichopoda]